MRGLRRRWYTRPIVGDGYVCRIRTALEAPARPVLRVSLPELGPWPQAAEFLVFAAWVSKTRRNDVISVKDV